MGLFDWIKGGLQDVATKNADDVLAPYMPALLDAAQKDFDYAAFTPEAEQNLNFSGFAVPNVNTFWTDGTNYADKADKLTKQCAVSARCLQMRADAVASVPLLIKGSDDVQQLFRQPNFRDLTFQAAWKSWVYQTGIGGSVKLFLNMSVPGRATLESLRQDLVANNIKKSRWEYNPGAMKGAGTKPSLIFNYDASGATTAAYRLNGDGATYSEFPGALIDISYYDPTSPTKGLAPGDAALRAVDIILLIDDLIQRKFRTGGTKNGFFKWNQGITGQDTARLQAQIATLNQGNNLQVMPNGMDFVAAQLTFGEMDLLNIKKAAAADIATAFGIDVSMINQGASTHANQRANDKIFFRNFIGPESWWFVGQLEAAIKKYLDPKASITVDETQIQHIQDDLDDKLVKWAGAGVFTLDECRAIVGKAPLPNGEGKALATSKPSAGEGTGLGQPETKPGGETSFNANSGDRGDRNNNA